MRYKLICIDMDGTLLNSKNEISEENKKAIRKAVEKGVCVAVTTGRLFTSAKYFANLIGTKTPIISSNGAFIKEKDEDKIIYESTLNYDQMMKIYNVIKKYNLKAYFNMSSSIISESELPKDHSYKKMNEMIEKEEEKIQIIEKVDFREAFKKYDNEILKAICIEDKDLGSLSKAKDELKKYNDIEVVSSSLNNFEVMNVGTSKGKAVKVLAEILGIKKDEIMCIGDSENDLSMIKYAGLGVAMRNGLQLIKEEADYITDTNDNNGVSKAIEKFVLI